MSKKAWFEKLILTHESALLGYTKSIVKDYETSQDIVQESFLRAWKMGKKEISRYERAWLFRVSRNMSIDYIRSQKKTENIDESWDFSSPEISALEGLAIQEDVTWLQKAMKQLNDQQREVMMLKYQGEMSYKEIAAVVGLKANHVGVVLHAALKILQDVRKKQGVELASEQRLER